MAEFTLDQVPGWRLVADAAAAAGLPLAPLGARSWGDPDRLREAGETWTGVAGDASALGAPAGDLRTGSARLAAGWSGPAADRYLGYEAALADAFASAADSAAQLGAHLRDLANRGEDTQHALAGAVLSLAGMILSADTSVFTRSKAAPALVGAMSAFLNTVTGTYREQRDEAATAADRLREAATHPPPLPPLDPPRH